MTWWTWPGLRGAVLEHVPGRLLDIGAGGCSVETSTPLGAGTFGFVEIEGPDASLAEVARVCTVTERPGATAPFLVRLEFLPIPLPLHLTAGDRGPRAAATPLAAAGEKAGPSLTLVRRREPNDGEANCALAHNGPEAHRDAASEAYGDALADALKK
jgi:hypothetical protein